VRVPKALVGVLAVAASGVLLWCAREILTSELPRGAGVAAWVLWLVAAAALLTLVAWLRELAVHHDAIRGGGSWRPVPPLLLLWVGGLTAVVSLPLVLPGQTAAAGSTPAHASASSPTSGPATAPTTAPTTAPATPGRP
jgi:hypothetical protein